MVLTAEPLTFPPPVRLHGLALASRYLLAPLAGYTQLPFRLAVRGVGGLGLATTDLVNARALLRGSVKTVELIQTCAEDYPLAVQLYGTEPREVADAAQWLEEYGVASIDINMGCPVRKVTKGGGGSAMLCNAGGAVALVRTVVEATRLPVTVKMRLGWDSESITAPLFAREFEQAGVAGLTIHGRTRDQGFRGSVDLDGIRAVAAAVERIPVFGNGDVRSLADADRMLRLTGCTGLAIGRGALLNPWFFQQLLTWETTGEPGPAPGYLDRLEFMDRHFHLQVRQKGERFGCLSFRKVANWYCRVLKPGHETQQRLIMISTVEDFSAIVAQLRERYLRLGPPPGFTGEASIPVPGGAIEHW